MARVEKKNFAVSVINQTGALNIICASGAFGEEESLQTTEMMYSRNTIVSKPPVPQDLIVRQDFNAVVESKNRTSLNTPKLSLNWTYRQ